MLVETSYILIPWHMEGKKQQNIRREESTMEEVKWLQKLIVGKIGFG